MADLSLGPHRLPIPIRADGTLDVLPKPAEVIARVRALLPQVRGAALDAYDHRLPDAVVGALHQAANELEIALGAARGRSG